MFMANITTASVDMQRVSHVQADRSPRPASERALRDALAQDQLMLHYEPQICPDTGRTVGVEAQIRWPHRTLPVTARSTLAIRLGGWVLRTACAEAADQPGWDTVSVNVAAPQLDGGTLLDQVVEALDLSELAPERLVLKLRQEDLSDDEVELMLMLSAIRDLGVGLTLTGVGSWPVSCERL